MSAPYRPSFVQKRELFIGLSFACSLVGGQSSVDCRRDRSVVERIVDAFAVDQHGWRAVVSGCAGGLQALRYGRHMLLICQTGCKRILIEIQFPSVVDQALHEKCVRAGGSCLEYSIMVDPEPSLVGGTLARLGGQGRAGFVLLQGKVSEFQLDFSGGDIVVNEAGLYALVEGGTSRTAKVFPSLNGYRGIGIAQDVPILPSGRNTGIVRKFN